MSDILASILERTRRTNARRALRPSPSPSPAPCGRGVRAVEVLRRPSDGPPRVIAEVKFRSPSAGVIRARRPGEAQRLARAYVDGGAAAVSVLADGPAFGGSPLDVRRVSETVSVPVLFKGFVLDERQIELASRVGASMVLLLVRAMPFDALERLVRHALALGLAPLVEAADDDELTLALETPATLIGVNARDLRTFRVDPEAARAQLERVPRDRVAIYMSGIRSAADLAWVAAGRVDAVLVGEGLARESDPAATLRAWLAG
ncbi:MAG: indole-3-glycerol-phosphate synthase [Myxococcota bacterium]|jgi:indole-3-glycerol phosphate synthase|nr:indole-3-glycerol-phosphate synthase [Myxococcota bacterium]